CQPSRQPTPTPVRGHVFNAVNQNGVIRFLDGQTGGPASFRGYSSFQFTVIAPAKFQ
ncbi:MAG: hypothetical protein HC846_09845, partial [Blastocatellia bacterium]|nr:hypothetical protein [Blastocatellia bacterium]